MADTVFWYSTPLSDMSETQWEQLCDGCGKCCLHKLEDDETGDVYYTKMACHQLDIASCRCQDYSNRLENVPGCVSVKQSDLDALYWLPVTCTYRILHEGGDMPDWHPLITGDRKEMVKRSVSVSHFAKPENSIPEDDWQDEIITWIV